MRYKPIIYTCEDCGKKSERVEKSILLKLNTPIISTAYLNKWSNLCPPCKNEKIALIEKKLADWPQAIESTEST